jgi:hypothetical protein
MQRIIVTAIGMGIRLVQAGSNTCSLHSPGVCHRQDRLGDEATLHDTSGYSCCESQLEEGSQS